MRYSSFQKYIPYVAVVLVLLFAIGFQVFAAWNPPGSDPPLGNVDSPLNISVNNQIKQGALWICANGSCPGAGNAGFVVERGNVGIGTISPQGALDVVSTTGAFIVPRMTTAQRDSLAVVNGMIIYNTTTNQFNFLENGAWVLK